MDWWIISIPFGGVFVSEFEIQRQIELLESGGEVENETRSFDAESRCVLCVCVP